MLAAATGLPSFHAQKQLRQVAPRYAMKLHTIVLSLILSTSTSYAQVLINQSGAINGNIAPGDLPGFPVEIKQPGSYRLSSNLVIPAGNPNQSAIVVSAPNVTIDLNGFLIQGVGSCFQEIDLDVIYAGSNSSVGIVGANDTTIRNGAIRGFQHAVHITGRGTVESLAVSNSYNGIVIGQAQDGSTTGSRVVDSSVEFTVNAIQMHSGSVERVAVTRNQSGIIGGGAGRTSVRDSFVSGNKLGIAHSAVRGNRVTGNGQDLQVGTTTSY